MGGGPTSWPVVKLSEKSVSQGGYPLGGRLFHHELTTLRVIVIPVSRRQSRQANSVWNENLPFELFPRSGVPAIHSMVQPHSVRDLLFEDDAFLGPPIHGQRCGENPWPIVAFASGSHPSSFPNISSGFVIIPYFSGRTCGRL